jgi:hypothetical protein
VIERSGGVVAERMPKKREIERRIKIINNIAKGLKQDKLLYSK